MRRPYPDSLDQLGQHADITGVPMVAIERLPRHDDEVPGPSIFRSAVVDAALTDLTLPGLYVCRSELSAVSFRGSDLHLSAFNWSDILDCDFADTDFASADLRACEFSRCSFARANLTGADLRLSSFDGCLFEGAVMTGTKLTRGHEPAGLSVAQRAAVAWTDDAPEPGGG